MVSTPASQRGSARLGIIIGIVVAGLLFVGAIVAWFAAGPLIAFASQSVEVTGDPTVDLPGLRERSVIRAADDSPLAVLADEFDREAVELQHIPTHVRDAVVAAEDRRFYSHEGYDVNAIMRAAFANLQAGEVEQGASTITQQLAQINFLSGEQTFRRKLEEVRVARALEDEYTKDELLERYLNQVYLGAGSYGFQAGAQQFFGVNVEDLTVEQAALLAGMIRSPTHLDPRRHAGAAKSRRDDVLRAMAEERYIDGAQAQELIATPIDVIPAWERTPDQPYVVEAVKREFFNNEVFGETREERIDLLFAGGLQVRTTVLPDLQDAADDVVSAAFPGSTGPTAALVAVHPLHGGIIALHGGKDFSEVQFDLATQGRRQPGSALKPLVAASALEQGISPEISLPGNGPISLNVAGSAEPFTVQNFANSDHGTVDLREALVSSVNTAFAALITQSGVEEAIDLADQAGFNVERAFGPENTWGPAIVLGGLTHGVTPLEMASLYSMFANEGIRAEPHLIDKVVDSSGEVLYEREPVARRVLDPAVAAAMVDMLTDVVERGTGTRAQLDGIDVIGKTGTTQDNTDAWFVGAVPLLSTAVWVGHAEGQVTMPDMTGGSTPATIWREFMEIALADVEVPSFVDDELDLEALPTPAPDPEDEQTPSTSSPLPPPPSPAPTFRAPPRPQPPTLPPPPPSPEPAPTSTYSPPPAPPPPTITPQPPSSRSSPPPSDDDAQPPSSSSQGGGPAPPALPGN